MYILYCTKNHNIYLSFPLYIYALKVDNKDDFNEDTVIRKLRASGGAHQPTSYEFANYSL